MSDELDSLNDTTLSEVFASEVADMDLSFNCDPDNECYTECALHHTEQLKKAHVFATSADAVIPFIAQWSKEHNEGGEPEYFVFHSPPPIEGGLWNCEHVWDHHDGAIPIGLGAMAPTFARSACIALIRAKRAKKGKE